MRKAVICTMFLAGLLAAFACDSHFPTAPDDDWVISPAGNYEAEALAVVLSRELLAPLNLYERIRTDLDSIRLLYADSIAPIDIHYTPNWRLGYLTMQVDSSILNDSSSAGFAAFDSLTGYYGLDSAQEHYGTVLELYFHRRYNPIRLMEKFVSVEGIQIIEPGGMEGDGPNLYIYPDGNELKYFFRDAWGDCQAGCIYSDVYYVRTRPGQLVFVGSHLIDPADTTEPPAWVDTFYLAYDTMTYTSRWEAD